MSLHFLEIQAYFACVGISASLYSASAKIVPSTSQLCQLWVATREKSISDLRTV